MDRAAPDEGRKKASLLFTVVALCHLAQGVGTRTTRAARLFDARRIGRQTQGPRARGGRHDMIIIDHALYQLSNLTNQRL